MSDQAKSKGITILGVQAENFRRLRFAELEVLPESGLIRATGKNGSGKTSVLRLVNDGFAGAGDILPEAVHVGSEDGKGYLLIHLSNGYTIERRFSEAAPKGYLTVVGPDGGKHGQGKLNEWLGPMSFDPLAFFGLREERQREILLSLGKDPQLAAKIDALRARHAAKYAERTPWISQKRAAARVERPAGERPVPIDTSAEMALLAELQGQERARGDAALRVRDARSAAERAAAPVTAAAKLVADLERQLKQAKGALAKREHEQELAIAAVEHAAAAYARLPDPSEELATVKARLSIAGETERALEPWRRWDQVQLELTEATAAEQALTAEMDALEEQEEKLIAAAEMPVAGLTFSDSGAPLLNNLPLSVASGAEKIRVAVAVALAVDPQLKVCLIDEANDIDLEGLEQLDALAKANGFQIWAARIGLEGPGEIIVEDGIARNRDGEREAAPAADQPARLSLV